MEDLSDNDVSHKQDRQCAYNVELRRVRVNIVAVEKYYLFPVFVALGI